MSAMFFASYAFGTLSDKIGRKKTSFIALIMVATGILVSSFMPEYISFTIVRFITGFGKFRNKLVGSYIQKKFIVTPSRFNWGVCNTIHSECGAGG